MVYGMYAFVWNCLSNQFAWISHVFSLNSTFSCTTFPHRSYILSFEGKNTCIPNRLLLLGNGAMHLSMLLFRTRPGNNNNNNRHTTDNKTCFDFDKIKSKMLRASNHIALVCCIVFYGQRNALVKGNGYQKSKRKEEVTKQVCFYSFNLGIYIPIRTESSESYKKKYQSMECWMDFTKW